MTSYQRAQRKRRNQRLRWFFLDVIGLVSIAVIILGALFLVGSTF